MIKYTLILLFLLSFKTYGKTPFLLETKLTITHSLKHPIKRIEVNLIPYGDSLLIRVEASTTYSNVDISKYNYKFTTNLNKSQKLKNYIKKIKPATFIDDLDWRSFDGYTADLIVDGFGGALNYRLKSPTMDTKKRRLTKFVQLIRYILILAKLNPDEILNS